MRNNFKINLEASEKLELIRLIAMPIAKLKKLKNLKAEAEVAIAIKLEAAKIAALIEAEEAEEVAIAEQIILKGEAA